MKSRHPSNWSRCGYVVEAYVLRDSIGTEVPRRQYESSQAPTISRESSLDLKSCGRIS